MTSSPKISEFLQSRIDAGDFPSAVYLVAENGEIRFQDALGYAVVEPERTAARVDTIYDIASLTKPLSTALIIAKMVESGELDPNAPLGDLLNEFYVSGNAEITINQLMMHTSGMPAWRPLYLLTDSPEQIAEELASTLPGADQEPVTYSDLNYISLGLIAESIRGASIAEIFEESVAGPLGLLDTEFNPSPERRSRIAASEKGNEYEKQTCVDMGFLDANASGPFRDGVIWGEVHDGNAFYMRGEAGHAGLFSTADDIFTIAEQFLPGRTRLLKPETCDLFRTNFTAGMNEDRSFGFQLASTEGSTAGTGMSPESFGHNGFTGTCLWIDPARERILVLLTNRTHNRNLPFENINSVRRRFNDLATELLDEKNSN